MGVQKRVLSPPKHLKSSQEILSLVGKIDKKKEMKVSDFRINKLMKKEKKMAQHSHLLKSAMIKVKTSKHCKDAREQKKEEKKSKKRKHSDFKSPKANATRIKNVSIQKPKKEKIIKTPKKEKKEKNVERLFVFV